MKRVLVAVAACMTLFSGVSKAEVFFGINYAATLGEIKSSYPKAQYVKLNSAWITESDAFIKITGAGLGVDIRVAFEDLRPAAKKLFLLENQKTEADQMVSDGFKSMMAKTDDEALTVEWVRLTYMSPIPIDVFKKRYGNPSKCEHDESFNLMCRWPEKALIAGMSADGKFVTNAESSFTKSEKQLLFIRSGKPIPEWLK